MIYRSNLRCPDLDPAFIHTFRTVGGCNHDVLHDEDFDRGCGYMHHDEAAILYHIVKAVGGSWAEIGTHTGWSICHAALAAETVVGIDPEFKQPEFLTRTEENINACDLPINVELYAGLSEEFFGDNEGRYDGVIVDGCHSSPAPVHDAQMAWAHLKLRGAVVLHDCVGQPTYDAVQFLIDQGLQWRVYNTPQMLTVCWGGDITMPDHTPDPAVDWKSVRAEMPFDWSRES